MERRRKTWKRVLAVLLTCVLAMETWSSVAWAGQQETVNPETQEGDISSGSELDDGDTTEKDVETDEPVTETPGLPEETEAAADDTEEEQAEGAAVDEENFPDSSLREMIKLLTDTDSDGYLSREEREAVTQLDIAHSEIFSLEGLEQFTKLKELDVSWNHVNKNEAEALLIEEHFADLEKTAIRNNSYLADTEEEVIEEMDAEGDFTWVSIISSEEFQEVQIDEVTFPDEAFRSFVGEQYDRDQDQKLSPEEMKPVTSLYLKDREIQDLTGLEHFKNLVFLECSENQLQELEVSALKELRGLYCKLNQITALDLTENIHLRQLECDENVEISGWKTPTPEGEEDGNQDLEKESLGAAASYKVTFDSSGGSAVKAQIVQRGEKASAPKPPAKSKYIFAGWYLDSKKYDFDAVVKKNITLTAKWSKVTVARAAISKTSNSKKGVLNVSYKKLTKVSGYDVQIARASNFRTGLKRYYTTSLSQNFSKMYQGKTYYVRVRGYRYDSKKVKIFGSFSPVKTVKISNGIVLVNPSVKAITMKSVTLASKNTIRIQAYSPNEVRSVDGYYYLINLTATEAHFPTQRKPIGKLTKRTNMTFDVPLYFNTKYNRLHRRFVIAVRTGKSPDTYQQVTSAEFISNPEKLASYNYTFPKASTKKGLQVNEFNIPDAKNLGVKNTTYNMCLDDMIALPSRRNNTYGISYKYDGGTYWFDRGVIESYDRTLNQYKSNNMVVSAIILLRYRSDLTYLIPSGGRYYRDGFYALNTASNEARKQLEATFTFLAKRYASNGRIANWILGNEVNNYGTYHYTGSTSLSANARIYTNAFRLAYISIRSVYSKARLYISLDHLWNTIVAGGHGSKQFLNKFASYWASYGNFNIAYHAYPSPLTAPEFWLNTNGAISNSSNSSCISMGNIRVLTSYVKSKFGSGTRIILSEQGFTSRKYGVSVEKTQAAAIAYAYYLSEFNDMIDAFILHRHIDHQVEIDQGLALGLWTNIPGTYEDKHKKKYAWNVFRYMDTSKGASVTAFALPIIGTIKWSLIVPGYSAKRFS